MPEQFERNGMKGGKPGWLRPLFPLSVAVVLLLWSAPLWYAPHGTGVYDWGHFLKRYEALRRSFLYFHQWPGTMPWIMGGCPLLGNPEVGIFSVKTLFFLPLGVHWGVRLSLVASFAIAFWGAWKLSGLWWRDPLVRGAFAAYTAVNPALVFHLSAGHLCYTTLSYFPFIFYYLLRFREDRWSGLKAALVSAIAYVDNVAYVVVFGFLIVGVLFLWLCVRDGRRHGRALARWAALFVPVFLALTAYRTVNILEIAIEYPRTDIPHWTHPASVLLHAFFVPQTYLLNPGYDVPGGCGNTWEICAYVGWTAAVLVLLSLRRGLRWWHVALALTAWGCVGNDQPWEIMYWIRKLPVYESLRNFMRLRMFVLFFAGIAAADGLNLLRRHAVRDGERARHSLLAITTLIGVLMAAEPAVVGHLTMLGSHVRLPFKNPNRPWAGMVSTSRIPFPAFLPTSEYPVNVPYEVMKYGMGWLGGPRDAWIPGETIRVGVESPEYRGEFHQGERAVIPTIWSPNHLRFEKLDPKAPLTVNLNPGRAWWGNGRRLFPDYRIVELEKPFDAMPDADGVLDLRYRAPGHAPGLLATALLAIPAAGVVWWFRRRDRRSDTGI